MRPYNYASQNMLLQSLHIYATIAEAYFGLRNYTAALHFIQQYIRREGINAWEIRSFSQQMFSLAYLQFYEKKFSKENETGHLATEPKLEEVVEEIDINA